MRNLLAIAVSVFVAVSLFSWGLVCRRLARGAPPLPLAQRSPTPWGLVDLLWAVLVLGFAQTIALQFAQNRLRLPANLPFDAWSLSARATGLFSTSIASLVALLCVLAWLSLRYRVRPAELGLRSDLVASDLGLGTLAFVMIAPPVYGIQYALAQHFESKHPLLELLKSDPDLRFFAVSFIAAVVVAPFVEEYLFRVLLQSWFDRIADQDDFGILLFGGLSPGSLPDSNLETRNAPAMLMASKLERADAPGPAHAWPVLLSSALFALMHWSHGPDPIPLFILALLLGFLYSRTRRILPCIVAHALLNATSLASLAITVKYGTA